MHPDNFSKNAPGKLVKTTADGESGWAFVPDPLPPALDYDAELVNAIAEARGAVGELAGLGRTLHNPHLLVRPFIRREAVASSRIEGTRSDIADLYAYEARRPKDRSQSDADVREVYNYVHALEYGIERRSSLPISLRLIREIHERLMEGARGGQRRPGEFRQTQAWIGSPDSTALDATYVRPPVPEMISCMGSLEKYIHADSPENRLVQMALIHYQFEAIHPFWDGNGRVGRLFLSLLTVHWDLLPHPLLYLSAAIEERRSDYYDLLLRVSTRGEWKAWLAFFLDRVSAGCHDALQSAKMLQDLRTEWRERVQATTSSARVLSLVDHLFEQPILTVPEAAEVMGITYPPAQKNLEKLENLGIVAQIEFAAGGRPRFYGAPEILDLLGM